MPAVIYTRLLLYPQHPGAVLGVDLLCVDVVLQPTNPAALIPINCTPSTLLLFAGLLQVVCEQLKVQSQNDTAKLTEAKQLVYLKVRAGQAGWAFGVMFVSNRLPCVCYYRAFFLFAISCTTYM